MSMIFFSLSDARYEPDLRLIRRERNRDMEDNSSSLSGGGSSTTERWGPSGRRLYTPSGITIGSSSSASSAHGKDF